MMSQRSMAIALTPKEMPSPRLSLTGLLAVPSFVEVVKGVLEGAGGPSAPDSGGTVDREGALVIVVSASVC